MDKIRGFEVISKYSELDIKLPERSTQNSAGYDFFAYADIVIPSHLNYWSECIDQYKHSTNNDRNWATPFCIKTGIKSYMQDDEVLQLYIRSSSPSKLGLVMSNSVGIIDSDYYNNPDNEGEIGFLVYNLSNKSIVIKAGEKIGQAVFTKFLKTDDDKVTAKRVGGYGSTGN